MKRFISLTMVVLMLFSLSLVSCSREQLDSKGLAENMHSILSGEEPKEIELTFTSEGNSVVLKTITDGKSGSVSGTITPEGQSSVSCPDIIKQCNEITYINVSSLSLFVQMLSDGEAEDDLLSDFEGMYVDIGTFGTGENIKKISDIITNYIFNIHLELISSEKGFYTAKELLDKIEKLGDEILKDKTALGGAFNEIRDYLFSKDFGINLDELIDESMKTVLMSDGFGIMLVDMILQELESDEEIMPDASIAPESGEASSDTTSGEEVAENTVAETISGEKGNVTSTFVFKDKDGKEATKIVISVKQISKDSFNADSYKPKDIEIVSMETFMEGLNHAIKVSGAEGETDDFPYNSETTADSLILTQENGLYTEKRIYTFGGTGVNREDVEYYTKEVYIHDALAHQLETDGYSLEVNDKEKLETGEASGYIKVYKSGSGGYGDVETPEELLEEMLGSL